MMYRLKAFVITLGVIVALAGAFPKTVSPASAKTTFLNFSAPVRLPGIVLPAGTYTFERVELSDRINVVRVLSRDRSKVYTTTLTRLVYRPTGMPPHEFVTFGEAGAGLAPPITAWFPYGERLGNQFVY